MHISDGVYKTAAGLQCANESSDNIPLWGNKKYLVAWIATSYFLSIPHSGKKMANCLHNAEINFGKGSAHCPYWNLCTPRLFLSHPFLGKSRNRQSNLDAGTKMNFDVGAAAKRQLRHFLRWPARQFELCPCWKRYGIPKNIDGKSLNKHARKIMRRIHTTFTVCCKVIKEIWLPPT